MDNSEKSQVMAENMTIPKSVFYNSLKNAIEKKDETCIHELADILHSSMQFHFIHNTGITDNTAQIEMQHQEIKNTLETMKEGFRQIDKRFEQVDKRFEQVDKRFEDLIQQMNARFEQVDKRFAEQNDKFRNQNWLIGAGFIFINTMMVMLKIFG